MARRPQDPYRPSVSKLHEALKKLNKWNAFALSLRGMEYYVIQKIQLNESKTEKQKLEVYDKCLNKCPDVTWDHVVTALRRADESTIAEEVQAKYIRELDTIVHSQTQQNETSTTEADFQVQQPESGSDCRRYSFHRSTGTGLEITTQTERPTQHLTYAEILAEEAEDAMEMNIHVRLKKKIKMKAKETDDLKAKYESEKQADKAEKENFKQQVKDLKKVVKQIKQEKTRLEQRNRDYELELERLRQEIKRSRGCVLQ